jgi:hypothetical protein
MLSGVLGYYAAIDRSRKSRRGDHGRFSRAIRLFGIVAPPAQSCRRSLVMSLFDQPFLSIAGRAPTAIADRLNRAARLWRGRREARRRRRISAALPADNHLRRDIGLPPVDKSGWPL